MVRGDLNTLDGTALSNLRRRHETQGGEILAGAWKPKGEENI